MDGGGEAVELVLQEREALGDADEEHVDPLGRRVLGGEQPDGVRGGAGAREVGPGRPPAEVRVGDLHQFAGARRPERGDEGSPAVAEDDDGAGEVGAGVGQVPQEVLVGRVPGAQRVARVLGVAGQREGAP